MEPNQANDVSQSFEKHTAPIYPYHQQIPNYATNLNSNIEPFIPQQTIINQITSSDPTDNTNVNSSFQVHTISASAQDNAEQNNFSEKSEDFGWKLISSVTTSTPNNCRVTVPDDGEAGEANSTSVIVTFTGLNIPPGRQEDAFPTSQSQKDQNKDSTSEQESPSIAQTVHASQIQSDAEKRLSPILSERISTPIPQISNQQTAAGYSCPAEYPYNGQAYWNATGHAESMSYARSGVIPSNIRAVEHTTTNPMMPEVNTNRDVYGGHLHIDASGKPSYVYPINPYHTAPLNQSQALNMAYENIDQSPIHRQLGAPFNPNHKYDVMNDPHYVNSTMPQQLSNTRGEVKASSSVQVAATHQMASTQPPAVGPPINSSPTVPSSSASLAINTSNNSNANNIEFPCQYPGCNKVFERRYNLTVHYRKHTDEKPYPCKFPECPERFKWRSSQAHHIKTRHQGQVPPPTSRNTRINLRRSANTSRYPQSHPVQSSYNTRRRTYQQFASENGTSQQEIQDARTGPPTKVQRSNYGSNLYNRRYD